MINVGCGLLWFVLCLLLYGVFFFFFKQKTAYEMRISDWSSDVCSSDLQDPAIGEQDGGMGVLPPGLPADDARHHATAMEQQDAAATEEIGRASCRERVCQ